jgi:hypothetical protein
MPLLWVRGRVKVTLPEASVDRIRSCLSVMGIDGVKLVAHRKLSGELRLLGCGINFHIRSSNDDRQLSSDPFWAAKNDGRPVSLDGSPIES